MRKALCTALLISGSLMLTMNAHAADKKSGSSERKLVPMKVINSKGYKAQLKSGLTVKVTELKNLKTPGKDCSLDVNSLQTLSNDLGWQPMGKGATAQINLQARVGQNGHPYCSGKGSGCVMTVEIPDAARLPAKLMR